MLASTNFLNLNEKYIKVLKYLQKPWFLKELMAKTANHAQLPLF